MANLGASKSFRSTEPQSFGESGQRIPTAMTANPIAAIALSKRAGNNCATPPPAIAPIKLARIKAAIEPKNTARGDLELPLRAIAASWLLSPISAKNTVIKLSPRSCQSINKSKVKSEPARSWGFPPWATGEPRRGQKSKLSTIE